MVLTILHHHCFFHTTIFPCFLKEETPIDFLSYSSLHCNYRIKKDRLDINSNLYIMSPQQKSQDLGFPLYMTACATVAALSGFNVGWHISM